jgi:hypothetical protein
MYGGVRLPLGYYGDSDRVAEIRCIAVGRRGAVGQTPRNPAYQPAEDLPGLPRVLLLGDSISIGYTCP